MRKFLGRLGILHQKFQRAFAFRVALGIDIHLTGPLHIGLASQNEDLEFGMCRYRQQQAKKCDESFGFHEPSLWQGYEDKQATAF